jgi:hypothetical protein
LSSLGKKRLETLWAIAGYAAGGSTACAAPTPCAEIPKQILVAASDVLMYTTIWKIYFQEDLSQKDLFGMLTELGLVTLVGAGTAYGVARGSTALLKEVSDWVGPAGWGACAAITGSLTGIVGIAWAMYCDRRYCETHTHVLSS